MSLDFSDYNTYLKAALIGSVFFFGVRGCNHYFQNKDEKFCKEFGYTKNKYGYMKMFKEDSTVALRPDKDRNDYALFDFKKNTVTLHGTSVSGTSKTGKTYYIDDRTVSISQYADNVIITSDNPKQNANWADAAKTFYNTELGIK